MTTLIHVWSSNFTQIGRWEMAFRRSYLPNKKVFFSEPVWGPLTEGTHSFHGSVPSEPPSALTCKNFIWIGLDFRSYSRQTDIQEGAYILLLQRQQQIFSVHMNVSRNQSVNRSRASPLAAAVFEVYGPMWLSTRLIAVYAPIPTCHSCEGD